MIFQLIEFSIENFKVFKERVTFSMIGKKSSESSVFECNGERLLKTSLIYGANGSGKSTLLQGISYLKHMVKNSVNMSNENQLPFNPFKFSKTIKTDTFVEIIFSLDDKFYKYNFSHNIKTITSENLYRVFKKGAMKPIFERRKQDIIVHSPFDKSKDIAQKTRDNVLFLTSASHRNNKLAISIIQGFSRINIIQSHEPTGYSGFTIKMAKEAQNKKKILRFLKKADFCINDIEFHEKKVPDKIREKYNIPSDARIDNIKFTHPIFNESGIETGNDTLELDEESSGTERFFKILGPIIDTLETGKVLCIDEFDNSLHPLLTKFIIDLFNKHNQNNAQLIVTSHDVNLLSYKDDFNKDHFRFTEKDKYGTAKLYSLAEFNLRNDTEYQKKYLEGRFGGLPFINSN